MTTLRHVSPSPPRTPLQNTTNAMSPEPPSPPFDTAKTTQSSKSRRKFSIPFFRHQNLDSSEDIPSPHSSLWDAPLAEQSLNTTLPRGDWNVSDMYIPPPPPESKSKKKGKGKRKTPSSPESPPAAISNTPSLRLDPNIHHPHLLDTITERSSRPTLRSFRPSSLSLRRESPSISTLRARTSALRKESFSLAGLPPATHSLTSLSSKSSLSLLDALLDEMSQPPLPNTPQYDPPERIPTPPGLPSFNTPEAIHYRLPSPKLSFRDRLRLTPTPEEVRYHRQTAHLPAGVVMRGDQGELIRGRWRQGGQSGHTGYGNQGALDSHPFNRAPLADIASEANEPVVGSVASAPPPATATGIGAAEVQPRCKRTYRKGTMWERFVEATCFVCCGVEPTVDNGQVARTVPQTAPVRGEATGQEATTMMTGARPAGRGKRPGRDRFHRFGGDGWMY